MKQFLVVLSFELSTYLKKKSFIISTLVMSLIIILGVSFPTIFDKLDFNKNNDNDIQKIAILDPENIIKDKELLEKYFKNSEWTEVDSTEKIKDLINSKKIDSGFEVKSGTEYTYFVNDLAVSDNNQQIFTSILKQIYEEKNIKNKGLNYDEINSIYNTNINSQVSVLGKDNAKNFLYAYILVFVIYFMTFIYGQLIATSVTNEKSNRTMEILVTSVYTNYLIFGKVVASTIISILQVSIIMICGFISYNINKDAWNNSLDKIFDIPPNILITFIVFGGFGYLFYALIFAVLGALVSKTEELSQSLTPISIIFIIAFFVSISGLNGNSSILKIASFVPFSSPMAMITRQAIETIPMIEVVISFSILLISIFVTGIIGAKIYRLSTLMYGNTIKLKDAFKLIKK